MVTDRDIFFFDLRGYLFLEGALSAQEVADMNAVLDAAPHLAPWGVVGQCTCAFVPGQRRTEPSADL